MSKIKGQEVRGHAGPNGETVYVKKDKKLYYWFKENDDDEGEEKPYLHNGHHVFREDGTMKLYYKTSMLSRKMYLDETNRRRRSLNWGGSQVPVNQKRRATITAASAAATVGASSIASHNEAGSSDSPEKLLRKFTLNVRQYIADTVSLMVTNTGQAASLENIGNVTERTCSLAYLFIKFKFIKASQRLLYNDYTPKNAPNSGVVFNGEFTSDVLRGRVKEEYEREGGSFAELRKLKLQIKTAINTGVNIHLESFANYLEALEAIISRLSEPDLTVEMMRRVIRVHIVTMIKNKDIMLGGEIAKSMCIVIRVLEELLLSTTVPDNLSEVIEVLSNAQQQFSVEQVRADFNLEERFKKVRENLTADLLRVFCLYKVFNSRNIKTFNSRKAFLDQWIAQAKNPSEFNLEEITVSLDELAVRQELEENHAEEKMPAGEDHADSLPPPPPPPPSVEVAVVAALPTPPTEVPKRDLQQEAATSEPSVEEAIAPAAELTVEEQVDAVPQAQQPPAAKPANLLAAIRGHDFMQRATPAKQDDSSTSDTQEQGGQFKHVSGLVAPREHQESQLSVLQQMLQKHAENKDQTTLTVENIDKMRVERAAQAAASGQTSGLQNAMMNSSVFMRAANAQQNTSEDARSDASSQASW